MTLTAIIRGGGDLSSGIALRLIHAGIQVIVTELPQPKAVRRKVAFAQAIYDQQIEIEGVVGRLVNNKDEAVRLLASGQIPILVDPTAAIRFQIPAQILIDGRMTKIPPEIGMEAASLVVGIGPGFIAGENCHAVVETKRGPFLGRLYWQGSAEPDSGLPDQVAKHQSDRVLRAPTAGVVKSYVQIGDHLDAGQAIAEVDGHVILAPFAGMLRGLIKEGLSVPAGEKVGDLDPRDDARLVHLVSDKALSIGGAVLEAILSRPELRRLLAE